MRQGQRRRAPFGKAAQTVERLGQVEVGRRGGRAQQAGVGEADPHRVPGEQDAGGAVVQGQVVFGMAGRMYGGQGAAMTDLDLLAVLQRPDPLRLGRRHTAVQRVESGAVHRGRRQDQAARVHQVACPPRMDVNSGVREGPGHVADAAGVVEMDVRHGHAGQILGPRPWLARASSKAVAELWLPVSTRTGAGPSTR